MKKKFYWIHKDYNNASLNQIAQRLVEYHTSELLENFDVKYTYENKRYKNSAVVGTIFLDDTYSVNDQHIINSIMNYNVYFKQKTEDFKKLSDRTIQHLDFIVSLASGTLQKECLERLNNYVIDISPTAIEKTREYLDIPESNYYQLDLFNIEKVEQFLKSIDGKIGFIDISNCFCYLPSSILFDIDLRINKLNQFLKCLQQDSRIWYINLTTPNGDQYSNVNVKDIPEIKIDDRFKVLPWIN
jgi:hypothetical protein